MAKKKESNIKKPPKESPKMQDNSRSNKKEEDIDISEGDPVCEKCGNSMIEEDGELVCPHCQGEIDFFGDSPC